MNNVLDFTDAVLLVGAVFAVTAFFDKLIPALKGWALQLVALATGIGLTFLVAWSDFGKTQRVGGIQLDNMNVASLVLIGLLLGGGATFADRTFTAVKNVGQNQGPPEIPQI